MKYRPLGRTGISVSAIAFGAGPVSGLLTGPTGEKQREVIERAVQLGINWFDTAATYGDGQSELSLGRVLSEIRTDRPLHVATKVRVHLTTQSDMRPLVVDSVRESLKRLRMNRVSLLQLHNSLTRNRNDQPTSITPEDVLGPRGILEGMQEVRARGWVEHFGLTGIGDSHSLNEVMNSRNFATIQAPVHLLNPSAIRSVPQALCDPNFGGFLQTAHQLQMGIFAIRVYAAGALIGNAPSPHTLKTPFFPIDLYRRDIERMHRLANVLGSQEAVSEKALQYVVSIPEIASSIIGFGEPKHLDQAVEVLEKPRLSEAEIKDIESLRDSCLLKASAD